MAVMGLHILEEAAECVCWWRNQSDRHHPLALVRGLLAECKQRQTFLRIVSWGLSFAAACFLLDARRRGEISYREQETIAFLISLCNFTTSLSFIRSALKPFSGLGVYARLVNQMLLTDVSKWSVLFLMYLLMFWFSLWVVRADDPAEGSDSHAFFSYLHDLFYFSAIADPGFVEPEAGRSLSSVTLTLLYQALVFFMSILLLNLLIAMMGNTYAAAENTAEREWRWDFARLVLQMELIFPSSDTHAGTFDRESGSYNYVYRRAVGFASDTQIMEDVVTESTRLDQLDQDCQDRPPASSKPGTPRMSDAARLGRVSFTRHASSPPTSSAALSPAGLLARATTLKGSMKNITMSFVVPAQHPSPSPQHHARKLSEHV